MKIQFQKYDALMKLEDMRPSRFQRNVHPPDQIERLAKIMRDCGVRQPIHISNQTGEIVFGHGRWEAARSNGWKEFPIVFQDFESLDAEYICVQNDNAISTWSELDLSMINADLENIGPFDLDLLGIKDFGMNPGDDEKKGPKLVQCPFCAKEFKHY